LLPASVSREALDKAREAGILVYSDSTLSEFVGVFLRPKFDKYLSLPKRLNAISTFEKLSQHIEVSVKVNIVVIQRII